MGGNNDIELSKYMMYRKDKKMGHKQLKINPRVIKHLGQDLITKAIDWSFIYDLVEEKYCPNNERPSIDPVMLIKIPFIQYLYGIKSMRQTMKEIEVNVAYRWFLGLNMMDSVPHFSTFGKNYTRRFKDTDLFEQIF